MADEQTPTDQPSPTDYGTMHLSPMRAFYALRELLDLARHYAGLLNAHDGGERLLPATVPEWIARIESKLPPAPKRESSSVSFESMVSSRNREPYVRMAVNGDLENAIQLNVVAARQISAQLIEAASAAEADALVFRFFSSRELPDEAIAMLIYDFRRYRIEFAEAAKKETSETVN